MQKVAQSSKLKAKDKDIANSCKFSISPGNTVFPSPLGEGRVIEKLLRFEVILQIDYF